MKNWIIKNSGPIARGYLGLSIGLFTNFYFISWQWWAILVPTILLFSLPKIEENEQ